MTQQETCSADPAIESLKQKSSSVDCSNLGVKGGTCDGEIVFDNDMEVTGLNMKTGNMEGLGSNDNIDKEKHMNVVPLSELSKSSLPDAVEDRGTKRPNDGEVDTDNKKCRAVTVDSDDETEAVEAKLVSNMNTLEDQSEIKEGTPIKDADGLPSQHLDEKFSCTACDKVALEIQQHPLLKVIICGECSSLMEEKINTKVWIYSY